MRGEAGLLADLASMAIPFAAHEHPAVFTVAESHKVDADIPGAHTKNLFLKDAGGAFWLVTVPALARVDLKALPAAIGCKRVSFGKPEDMERLLGITPAMAFACSLTALYGFPADYIITKDVIDTLTDDAAEREALTAHLLPPMLVAGFVTVTTSICAPPSPCCPVTASADRTSPTWGGRSA